MNKLCDKTFKNYTNIIMNAYKHISHNRVKPG